MNIISIAPYLIGVGAVVLIGLLLYAFGIDIRKYISKFSNGYREDLTRAAITMSPEDYMIGVLAVGTVLWVGALFLLFSNPILVAVALPLCIAIAVFLGTFLLKFLGKRRLGSFTDQLEMVLRMISGAMRVGLSLRQAIILVTEEIPDPAKREFQRVIGRTNIGVSIVDALNEVAAGMPGGEMEMFSKVVGVQQSTGGDLAKVLDKLASTIRDRRRVMRKMNGLTAQGRFGAFIIGFLPIGVGGFIIATQPDMSQALLHTFWGWIVLGIAAALELAAAFALSKILQLDV